MTTYTFNYTDMNTLERVSEKWNISEIKSQIRWILKDFGYNPVIKKQNVISVNEETGIVAVAGIGEFDVSSRVEPRIWFPEVKNR